MGMGLGEDRDRPGSSLSFTSSPDKIWKLRKVGRFSAAVLDHLLESQHSEEVSGLVF